MRLRRTMTNENRTRLFFSLRIFTSLRLCVEIFTAVHLNYPGIGCGALARSRCTHLATAVRVRKQVMDNKLDNALQQRLAALPTHQDGQTTYLAQRAVTDVVAAHLFPGAESTAMDAAAYQQVLETADAACGVLGYGRLVKIGPPLVPLAAAGLYWVKEAVVEPPLAERLIIDADAGVGAALADGDLLDARTHRLGLDEISRQHFKIPVTISDGLLAVLETAVNNPRWANDYKGIWHDICSMCIRSGRDLSPTTRDFTVIITGAGRQRYWRLLAVIREDGAGRPYLEMRLFDEPDPRQLFALGQVVMTPGVAALGVDVTAYLARHAAGDWGEIDSFDKQQNETAVKDGYRLLSAYNVPIGDGETERIWVITEADRSVTTLLLPEEY